MNLIFVTRFNSITLEENRAYRSKYGHACIYGSPTPLRNVSFHAMVYVIEMNNSTNQIEGIGLIRNQLWTDKYYKIYNTGDYNRYVYSSKYFLSRKQCFLSAEIAVILPRLEKCLFKGKGHLKRPKGFTRISDKVIARMDETKMAEDISNSFYVFFVQHFGRDIFN